MVANVLEAVAYDRMMLQLVGSLCMTHYVYLCGRGAEMHLLDLLDGIRGGLEESLFAYSGSIGVDGAFDKVPQSKLMEALLCAPLTR